MMEFVEYVPGGLAAAWMAFRMIVLLRNPQGQENT